MTRVAFLGLGHMGLPMALNLAKAGHEVIGFDVVPAAIDAARAAAWSWPTRGRMPRHPLTSSSRCSRAGGT